MGQFQGRRPRIEACQMAVNADGLALEEFFDWAKRTGLDRADYDCGSDGTLLIHGPHGVQVASPWDWIIKEEGGDFSVLPNGVFQKYFEAATGPSRTDCYHRAEVDEAKFTLLARDPQAPWLLRIWAGWRFLLGEDRAVVADALACARAMDRWRQVKRPTRTPFARIGPSLGAGRGGAER